MGLLDILPWKKKDDDFMDESFNHDSNSSFDPLSQQDPFHQDPMSDPLGDGLGQQYANQQNNSFNQQTPSGAPAYPQNTRASSQMSERTFSNPMSSQLVSDQSFQQNNNSSHDDRRDVELVLAKLDAIKAELDSVHQRVRTIEKTMSVGGEAPRRYKW